MKTIKKIWEHIFMVYGILLFVLTMLIIIIPVWLTTFMREPRRSKYLHFIFRGWMGVFMPLIGCPVKRKGKEHFRKGENYVVVLNHNSLVDIPVSSPWIPGPNKTLAKSEMAKVPIFGLIYTAGSILVDRKNTSSKKQSIQQMREVLDLGLHLCLYPEGTRNKTDKPLQPFYNGAFAVAVMAQKPIIPGLIFNTRKIYTTQDKYTARPQRIEIHFLPPVPTTGLTEQDIPELKEKVFKIMETYYVNNAR